MPRGNINRFFILSGKYIKTYLGIGIFIFLFILFFQPFTPEVTEFENKLLLIAGFGVITCIALLVAQVLFQNPLLHNEDNIIESSLFTSLYYFSIVGINSLAFIFYLRYVGGIPVDFAIVIRVVIIGIGAAAYVYLSKAFASVQNKYQQLITEDRNLKDTLRKFSENYANRYIELISESDSDNFRIQVSDLVYFKSADNYVEIGYEEGNLVKKKLIRNTLKNIELQLKEYNNFIRTHRTSIVNIQNIEKLHKNFNTYWLSLVNTKETIPVSRQYLMAVRDLF